MMLRVVIVLLSCGLFYGYEYRRRYLLHNRRCVTFCPRNMHVYHTKCDGKTLSQITCEEPLPYILGYTCGWSRCDCNGQLLFDETTGDCITADECPVVIGRRSRQYRDKRRKVKDRRTSKYHLSRKVNLREDED